MRACGAVAGLVVALLVLASAGAEAARLSDEAIERLFESVETDASACAAEAVASNSSEVSSRMRIQPWPALTLIRSRRINSLPPFHRGWRIAKMGTAAVRDADWIPAVPLSWGLSPCRPVTLRRHLSVVLPLSESR